MFDQSGELVRILAQQESRVAEAIMEVKKSIMFLMCTQNLLMQKSSLLMTHLEQKQIVLKILCKMLDDTLIMISNDTLENFLLKKEKN